MLFTAHEVCKSGFTLFESSDAPKHVELMKKRRLAKQVFMAGSTQT